jgi:hypothetical protein
MGHCLGGILSAGAELHTSNSDHLNGLCEGGKAYLGTTNPRYSNVKYCVVVGHEGTPQDPPLHALSSPHATKAFPSDWIPFTEIEAISEGEALATKVEGKVREFCVARETVESIAFRSRTRD